MGFVTKEHLLSVISYKPNAFAIATLASTDITGMIMYPVPSSATISGKSYVLFPWTVEKGGSLIDGMLVAADPETQNEHLMYTIYCTVKMFTSSHVK